MQEAGYQASGSAPNRSSRSCGRPRWSQAAACAPGRSARNPGLASRRTNRWRKEYGGLRLAQAKRLKTREPENARLQADRGGSSARYRHFAGGGVGKVLNPPRRRQAVDHVRPRPERLGTAGLSVLGQPRSTHRHRRCVPDDEAPLGRAAHRARDAVWPVRLSTDHGAPAGRRGRVNHQRVARLWRA